MEKIWTSYKERRGKYLEEGIKKRREEQNALRCYPVKLGTFPHPYSLTDQTEIRSQWWVGEEERQ